MAKMRLLTFMGMAVEFKEISFDTMQQELQLEEDQVEAFVIDGTNTTSNPIWPTHTLSNNTIFPSDNAGIPPQCNSPPNIYKHKKFKQ